jgi:hypothetical protein
MILAPSRIVSRNLLAAVPRYMNSPPKIKTCDTRIHDTRRHTLRNQNLPVPHTHAVLHTASHCTIDGRLSLVGKPSSPAYNSLSVFSTRWFYWSVVARSHGFVHEVVFVRQHVKSLKNSLNVGLVSPSVESMPRSIVSPIELSVLQTIVPCVLIVYACNMHFVRRSTSVSFRRFSVFGGICAARIHATSFYFS